MEIGLDGITMEFDGTTVLKNISTTINEGELVTLLGPSGCGKSTLLMILSGLLTTNKGQVLFGGKDVTMVEAEKRGIGMVFQNYALYPHFTVLKNIMFPLLMQKVKKSIATEKAIKYAKLVQIDHLLTRKPAQLSGGQQQRVAIARALVKNPQLLLMDEPLSNLDSHLRVEMRDEIRQIQQKVGITTVFVTHDQEEAFSISDRVLLMNDGILQQVAKPYDMYQDPNNLFVANFLGNPQINVIHSHLLTNKKWNEYSFGSTENEIYGWRPEHLYLTNEKDAICSGVINRIEILGKESLIHIQCDGFIVRALISSDTNVQTGERCHLGIKKQHVLVFDKQAGQRVRIQSKGAYEVESSSNLA